MYLEYHSSCGYSGCFEPTSAIDLLRSRARKDAAHAKSIHIPQIKSLFFLFLSLVRSAAKTNWCCDECNKYDRWDIWVLLTSHHAPEWREQVLLRFTAHLLVIFPSLTHTDSEPFWDTVTLLSFHSTPAAHADTQRNRLIIVSGYTSCPTWLCMNHITTNKTSNDFTDHQPVSPADSYYSNFYWEEHMGLSARSKNSLCVGS